MKTAFHFNADHPSVAGPYGQKIQNHLFRTLLGRAFLAMSSRVFVGDLMLLRLASDRRDTAREEHVVDIGTSAERLIEQWYSPPFTIWRRFSAGAVAQTLKHRVYVVCLESIDLTLAEYLANELETSPAYLGALEVDDSCLIHWRLYSDVLLPRYKLIDRRLYVFWDGPALDQTGDSKNSAAFEDLRRLPFDDVQWLSLNGKYTIFDQYRDFPHARRVAEWRQRFGGILAFLADGVVSGLSDVAPDLGDKLYAALKTFEAAETAEELAQVTASCRRILEYAADCLFPPLTGTDSDKLGPKHFRNRLLRFATEARRSNSNIDLIASSNSALADQLAKLGDLANKGVHSDVYRAEVRRCLLRTVMLLDDIMSLKTDPFEGRLD